MPAWSQGPVFHVFSNPLSGGICTGEQGMRRDGGVRGTSSCETHLWAQKSFIYADAQLSFSVTFLPADE